METTISYSLFAIGIDECINNDAVDQGDRSEGPGGALAQHVEDLKLFPFSVLAFFLIKKRCDGRHGRPMPRISDKQRSIYSIHLSKNLLIKVALIGSKWK